MARVCVVDVSALPVCLSSLSRSLSLSLALSLALSLSLSLSLSRSCLIGRKVSQTRRKTRARIDNTMHVEHVADDSRTVGGGRVGQT